MRKASGLRHRARLAYRDVASATNRVTLIAAVLRRIAYRRTPSSASGPGCHCGLNTSCGVFNSLIVNYLVRLRVGTHVTTALSAVAGATTEGRTRRFHCHRRHSLAAGPPPDLAAPAAERTCRPALSALAGGARACRRHVSLILREERDEIIREFRRADKNLEIN